MTLRLGDDQQVDIRLRPRDDAGAVLPDTGSMTCTADEPALATVTTRVASGEQATTGMPDGAFVANVRAAGGGELGILTLTATHTPADGGPPTLGTFDVEIVVTAEAGVGFEPGTPQHL